MKNRILVFAATLLVVLAAAAAGSADVVISEVMASNGWFENGHAWDWVELYNDGKETVNLSGWYFSDSKKDPLKWSFPSGTKLKGGAYLTVFCTGEETETVGKGNTFYTDFAISANSSAHFRNFSAASMIVVSSIGFSFLLSLISIANTMPKPP